MIRHLGLRVSGTLALLEIRRQIEGRNTPSPSGAGEKPTVDAMISYNLRCAKDHEFEGWFKDSAGFAEQRDAGDIECPVCGDRSIEQALSRPNISSGKTQSRAVAEKASEMKAALRRFRRHVEQTHDHVGENFAEEARKIHYGETEARPIYGDATADQAKDLVEEGVPIAPLPWIEEAKDN
jgi:hypothetical protein